MRHRHGYRKLGRATDQRMAMLRSIVSSLFERGKVTTTLAKAKEARRLAEKIVSLSKKGDLSARRQAGKVVESRLLLKNVFENMPKRFKERSSGYTRIIRIGVRRGDAAKLVILELT